MVIIIPYKRSTLESLEPTWIVLMSELTFASSRTGGMGRIMISMGTRWTSFTAAECTLLSEAIARNDVCIKQHTTTTTTKQIWRLESIAIAGTLQSLLHDVVFSMLSKVGKLEWMGFWKVLESGIRELQIFRSGFRKHANYGPWDGSSFSCLETVEINNILNAKNKEQTLTSSQTPPLNIKTSMNSKLPEEKSKR